MAETRESLPALMQRAGNRLIEAKSSAEVLEAKAMAEAALHYAKVTKAANETHADCLRIITRAEMRMANEVDQAQSRDEMARPGSNQHGEVPRTLGDLGLDSRRVSEWRDLRNAGEGAVEDAIAQALADGRAPTKSDIVNRARAATTQHEWTPEQERRRKRAEKGGCVVANLRLQDGKQIDGALLAWAEANERFVRIDRKTDWGNPFEMPDDGERAEVVGKFSKFYLPHKDGLLSRIPSLRGKVLACWCHPEECHGHIIAEIVNREAAGEGTAGALADHLADVDG